METVLILCKIYDGHQNDEKYLELDIFLAIFLLHSKQIVTEDQLLYFSWEF